jgi:transposase
MSSLIKKSIQGNQYYYIVDSKRVDGKPTHVNQIYLGPVKEVLEKLKEGAGATSPVSSTVLEFGAVAALYDIAERLAVVPLMDELSGKRRQGLSVGTYLLLAALNRALAPTSKKGLADWHAKTILSRLLPCGKQQLSSQRFWDHMKYWTDEAMETFERRFTAQLVERYGLPTRCVVYDATNFITYIDTMNPKADVAQRGHSKERRGDLRIVGLSLLVSSEEEIPLFYEVYEGNRPDAKQFSVVVERLRQRYAETFGQEAEITLVFDRGNNSQENLDLLAQEERPFHYVGGLRHDQCREVLAVPKSQYETLDGKEFGGTTAYRTEMNLLGRRLTVVATHNPELLEGQRQGVLLSREKCRQALVAQQERILRWETGEWRCGHAPTRESCEKNVADILKSQNMKTLFRIEWSHTGRYPSFTFAMPDEALAELEESSLGKTILYTDQHGWSNEQIVHAYRSAWRIEGVFRQMKSPEHLSVRPMWHWTSPMIRVHVFCCVLAYRLCCLLRRELKAKGVDLSLDQLLDLLGEKRQLVHYYQRKRGLKETYSMSESSEETDRLLGLLDLQRYQLG